MSRDVAELRSRGLLTGHLTAGAAYVGEAEAISVVGALDAAVGQAVAGEASAADSLATAAAKWREITARIGLESQRRALKAGLNTEGKAHFTLGGANLPHRIAQ